MTKHAFLRVEVLGADLAMNVASHTSALLLAHVDQLRLEGAKGRLALVAMMIAVSTPLEMRRHHAGK